MEEARQQTRRERVVTPIPVPRDLGLSESEAEELKRTFKNHLSQRLESKRAQLARPVVVVVEWEIEIIYVV